MNYSARDKYVLRRQVDSEVKLRRVLVNTVLALFLCYILGSLIFSDMGLLRYLELKEKHNAIESELKYVEQHNSELSAKINKYKTNNFYVEKNAREEFNMAEKDEIIFLYSE